MIEGYFVNYFVKIKETKKIARQKTLQFGTCH